MVAAIIVIPQVAGAFPNPQAVERLVNGLHSARVLDSVLVVPQDSSFGQADAGRLSPGVSVVRSMHRGELGDVQSALDSLPATGEQGERLSGAMICSLESGTLTQRFLVELLQAFWKTTQSIVVPLRDGRRGYPVIVATDAFDLLRTAPPEQRIHEFLERQTDRVLEVATADMPA